MIEALGIQLALMGETSSSAASVPANISQHTTSKSQISERQQSVLSSLGIMSAFVYKEYV